MSLISLQTTSHGHSISFQRLKLLCCHTGDWNYHCHCSWLFEVELSEVGKTLWLPILHRFTAFNSQSMCFFADGPIYDSQWSWRHFDLSYWWTSFWVFLTSMKKFSQWTIIFGSCDRWFILDPNAHNQRWGESSASIERQDVTTTQMRNPECGSVLLLVQQANGDFIHFMHLCVFHSVL